MDKLRGWVGALGWCLFIWSYAGTEEDYFAEIYWQEFERREGSHGTEDYAEVTP